jgi:sarcosine oxidase
VAQDAGGKPVDPDTRSFEPDAENFARVERFLQRYVPAALGPVIYTKTCLYTLTPDRDFVIDFVPGHPNVSFAIGAGHAFKFASVIGRILGELVADGFTPSDIGAFGAGREILTMADPPKSYMV